MYFKLKKYVLIALLVFVVFIASFLIYKQNKYQEYWSGRKSMADDSVIVESSYPNMTKEELVTESELVIEAKYKGHTPPFKVVPEDGRAPMVFKDSKFEIVKVYKGNKSEGDVIAVRSLGGQVENPDGSITSTSSDEFNIKYNGKNNYLFFLSSYPGGDYKTKEDYYNPVAGPNGIYVKVDKEESFVQMNDRDSLIERNFLENITDTTNPTDIYLQRLEESLHSGQITEEEYQGALEKFNTFDQKVE